MHVLTVPKCFKIELNDEGKATIHYRNCSHEQWQGPMVILKVCTSFLCPFIVSFSSLSLGPKSLSRASKLLSMFEVKAYAATSIILRHFIYSSSI